MQNTNHQNRISKELEALGLEAGFIFHNLSTPRILEESLRLGEGILGEKGELIVHTGKFTGRSPQDKFIVQNSATKDVDWGEVNQPISQKTFDKLLLKVNAFLAQRSLYVYEGFAGADEKNHLGVRIVSMKAWHHHFSKNMFREASSSSLMDFSPDFTIINACDFSETEEFKELGLRSDVFVLFDFEKRLALIGGTHYSGEIKKGIFSVLNYILPKKKIMTMHCSINCDEKGDSALFFGLSGTGKTTLSSDESRYLVGDDEHGWSEEGVFNFEGGCYAKAIHLSRKKEPEIYDAIRFGAILENVGLDFQTRKVDYDSNLFTENTRVSYPLSHIKKIKENGKANHPKSIIFLTSDAYGVIPPVAKLTPKQASYHFLSGFTAKIAGTERGIKEPVPTFSPCFGSPFMMHHPNVYGELLFQKMNEHEAPAYLVNTGWFGGAFFEMPRISLSITRRLVRAILEGSIESAVFEKDPIFGYESIVSFEDMEEKSLSQRSAWKTTDAYDEARIKLAKLFLQNFLKFDNKELAKEGGPKVF